MDVALIGDLREVLALIQPQVKKADHADWWATINSRRGDAAVRDIQSLPDSGHLYAAHVINDLWRLTQKRDTIVVTDVGQHQMWEAQYYRHEKPRSLITSGGLGTMGFALPAAIGAKFACPEKEVWVVVGDGGFQMTSCELATAEQEGIKVNVAIINNSFLGMVRQWQEFFYDKRYAATPMTGPDFVKLAEAYRLKGLRCNKRSDVKSTVEKTLAAKGTVVIDFVVEKEDTVFPMVPAGADLDKMIRRPKQDVMLGVRLRQGLGDARREWRRFESRERPRREVQVRQGLRARPQGRQNPPLTNTRHGQTYAHRLRGRRARRAQPRRLALPPPQLQHRLAHRRPHRAAGRLAPDRRGRRHRGRRPHRRGQPLQARQRPPRRRPHPQALAHPRARPRQGHGHARRPAPRCCSWSRSSAPAWSTSTS